MHDPWAASDPATEKDRPYLLLDRLRKSYGATTVVHDLTLGIRKGEFVSILGPSGCGKTTTLRMVAGFLYPESGAILLDGERIDRTPSHKRGTAMVFQNYALFPHMTVFDNIAFGLRMHKTPRQEIGRRVEQALEIVRLTGFHRRYPRELSGGQQQRVALARAIVLNPKLLLLDEPLSNLDAKLRKELRNEFLEVHRKAGITTLFVTHDLEEAFYVSDRVAVMNHGRLEQFAPPVEIFSRPQTRFVADFVGHSNIVDGPAARDGSDRPVLRLGQLTVRIPGDVPEGRSVRFAIPAHALRLSATAFMEENVFPARVARANYLGSTIQFQVDLDGLLLSGEIHPTPELHGLRAGSSVYVGWRGADMIPLPSDG